MKLPERKFEIRDAVRERVPLIIGVAGPSGSGKTYSALRLATGIRSAIGGDIHVVDTESKRAAHYADFFKFKHVPMVAPFGPLDYVVAFEQCIAAGARIIVADSMTHEHDGEGGVLDQMEEFLERKAGDNWDKRNQFLMLANVKPKAERKYLNRYIVQHGDVVWILCYRAKDKTKPLKKGETSPTGEKIVHLGWQPLTTSDLVFEMTARFLLGPASEGSPTLNPSEEAERMMIKNPRQFAGWVQAGQQLSEELGEKMARWAVGEPSKEPGKPAEPKKRDPVAGLTALLALGQWPDAEARVLAAYKKNHRSELADGDIAQLTHDYRIVKANPEAFDKIFPPLPEGGTAG